MGYMGWNPGVIKGVVNSDIPRTINSLNSAISSLSSIELPEDCGIDLSSIIDSITNVMNSLSSIGNEIEGTITAIEAAERGNVELALGFGDKEFETPDWLYDRVRENVGEENWESAKKHLDSAAAEGKTQFEALIDIATQTRVSVDDFLQSCGYKTREEIEEHKDYIDLALCEWSLASGNFGESVQLGYYAKYDENGLQVRCNKGDKGAQFVFNGEEKVDKNGQKSNPSLFAAMTTFDTTATVYGYVHGYDMVSAGDPHYISEDGKVYTTEELFTENIFRTFYDLTDSDEVTSMYNVFAGTCNDNHNRNLLNQMIECDYTQPNVVHEDNRIYYKNAERNIRLMTEYLNEKYGDPLNLSKIQTEYERFMQTEEYLNAPLDMDMFFKDSMTNMQLCFWKDLYEAYFSSRGDRIVGDKNGKNGYAVYDLNGNKVDTDLIFEETFHPLLREVSEGYRNHTQENLLDYIQNYGEDDFYCNTTFRFSMPNSLLYDLDIIGYNITKQGIIPQLALERGIEDKALKGWDYIANAGLNFAVGVADTGEKVLDAGAGGWYYLYKYSRIGDLQGLENNYNLYAIYCEENGDTAKATEWREKANAVHEEIEQLWQGDEEHLRNVKGFITRDLSDEWKNQLDQAGWAMDSNSAIFMQGLGAAAPETAAAVFGAWWVKPALKTVESFGEGIEHGFTEQQSNPSITDERILVVSAGNAAVVLTTEIVVEKFCDDPIGFWKETTLRGAMNLIQENAGDIGVDYALDGELNESDQSLGMRVADNSARGIFKAALTSAVTNGDIPYMEKLSATLKEHNVPVQLDTLMGEMDENTRDSMVEGIVGEIEKWFESLL